MRIGKKKIVNIIIKYFVTISNICIKKSLFKNISKCFSELIKNKLNKSIAHYILVYKLTIITYLLYY